MPRFMPSVHAAALATLLLSACGSSDAPDVPGQGPGNGGGSGPINEATGDAVPRQDMRILNALPPGQSGFVSVTGQAQGAATGQAADYGEHLDDQRLMYWSFQLKPGGFADISERTPEQPREGVRIYRDDFGVPIVYADGIDNVGFGTGFALAQDRLFLQDAGRRLARGTLAELTGGGDVPNDIQTRVLTYSEAEYQAMFDRQGEQIRTLVEGFVAGTNAWIAEVRANPALLPAEYALLQTLPEPITVTDVMAAGVLITRAVASAGGNEFDNVRALKALTAMHGEATARTILRDVLWFDDRKAAVTVPLEEGTFSNITTPADRRDAVFNAMADFAVDLPDSLAEGPGTGAAPVPGLPDAVTDLNPGGIGDELARRVRRMFDVSGGASYMLAVTPERSANGRPLLFNGPQLGYSYPSQLMEIEVHGAGIDVRGATAPLLPVVGIGYGERTAFGVTTGNSKTIDSFIETLVEGNPKQYRHNGEIKDMDCRMETVRYRQAQQGVPLGPDLFSREIEVCRTVHGPVVARSDDGRFARTLDYAMWNREVDTINGVMKWGMVDTFEAFDAAMREVTWNENTMFVGADGNVAYYHPGLHPVRASEGDQRFPLPGTGAFDHDGFMAFDQLPHVINPQQGYVANWNEKPAYGWGEGIGGNARSRPAGPAHRVTNWTSQASADGQISFDDILAFDKEAGIRDPRAEAVVPILAELRADATLSDRQTALIDVVLAWNRHHYREDIDIEDENATDTPGATVFDVIVRAVLDELFADDLPQALFDRMTAVGNHEYDAPPLLNLAIRILDPAQSSLETTFDFTNGQGAQAALIAAIDTADQRLQAQFDGTDIASYRRVHHRDEVCSLTGGIIGPCLTMPHQDRGSWNEVVGFE